MSFVLIATGVGVAATVGCTVATIVEGQKASNAAIDNSNKTAVVSAYVDTASVYASTPTAVPIPSQ